MNWNLEDKEAYVAHLQKEYRKENRKPESLARVVNLHNITADLNSIDLTH